MRWLHNALRGGEDFDDEGEDDDADAAMLLFDDNNDEVVVVGGVGCELERWKLFLLVLAGNAVGDGCADGIASSFSSTPDVMLLLINIVDQLAFSSHEAAFT